MSYLFLSQSVVMANDKDYITIEIQKLETAQRCGVCDGLLVIPPIYSCLSVTYICGPCFDGFRYYLGSDDLRSLDKPVRQILYEIYATSARFQCPYHPYCNEIIRFGQDAKLHFEKYCFSNTVCSYKCPISRANRWFIPPDEIYCCWKYRRTTFMADENQKMRKHIKLFHDEYIMERPYIIKLRDLKNYQQPRRLFLLLIDECNNIAVLMTEITTTEIIFRCRVNEYADSITAEKDPYECCITLIPSNERFSSLSDIKLDCVRMDSNDVEYPWETVRFPLRHLIEETCFKVTVYPRSKMRRLMPYLHRERQLKRYDETSESSLVMTDSGTSSEATSTVIESNETESEVLSPKSSNSEMLAGKLLELCKNDYEDRKSIYMSDLKLCKRATDTVFSSYNKEDSRPIQEFSSHFEKDDDLTVDVNMPEDEINREIDIHLNLAPVHSPYESTDNFEYLDIATIAIENDTSKLMESISSNSFELKNQIKNVKSEIEQTKILSSQPIEDTQRETEHITSATDSSSGNINMYYISECPSGGIQFDTEPYAGKFFEEIEEVPEEQTSETCIKNEKNEESISQHLAETSSIINQHENLIHIDSDVQIQHNVKFLSPLFESNGITEMNVPHNQLIGIIYSKLSEHIQNISSMTEKFRKLNEKICTKLDAYNETEGFQQPITSAMLNQSQNVEVISNGLLDIKKLNTMTTIRKTKPLSKAQFVFFSEETNRESPPEYSEEYMMNFSCESTQDTTSNEELNCVEVQQKVITPTDQHEKQFTENERLFPIVISKDQNQTMKFISTMTIENDDDQLEKVQKIFEAFQIVTSEVEENNRTGKEFISEENHSEKKSFSKTSEKNEISISNYPQTITFQISPK